MNCILQAMVIFAWSGASFSEILQKEVVYSVSSIFITAAFLRFLQSNVFWLDCSSKIVCLSHLSNIKCIRILHSLRASFSHFLHRSIFSQNPYDQGSYCELLKFGIIRCGKWVMDKFVKPNWKCSTKNSARRE